MEDSIEQYNKNFKLHEYQKAILEEYKYKNYLFSSSLSLASTLQPMALDHLRYAIFNPSFCKPK